MDALISDVIGGLALVLVLSTLMSALARRFGQPKVIGQIVAGLLLGPSVLGRLPGHLVGHLFPAGGIPSLNALAQVAVSIFMFVVGYELDLRALRGRRRAPTFVACAALAVPLGVACLAVLAFRGPIGTLAQHSVDAPFVLYIGIAMSITALPVLAAIVRERGIAGSLAGVTATSAAGLMDAVAWLVLAGVIAAATHKAGRPWGVTLLLFLAFLVVMAGVVRPILGHWLRRSDAVLANQLPIAVALGLGGAWVTAALGLHPVFGAFVAGLVMPTVSGTPDPDVLRPLEEAGGLFLPLFFAVTGLSLNVEAMNGTAFLVLSGVCLIAALGKLLPGYAGARLGGLGHHDAAVVAALVNTRGLTELIALNLGLSTGLISPRMFAVLVLMAVITTLMTAPLLRTLKSRAPHSTGPTVAATPKLGGASQADELNASSGG